MLENNKRIALFLVILGASQIFVIPNGEGRVDQSQAELCVKFENDNSWYCPEANYR